MVKSAGKILKTCFSVFLCTVMVSSVNFEAKGMEGSESNFELFTTTESAQEAVLSEIPTPTTAPAQRVADSYILTGDLYVRTGASPYSAIIKALKKGEMPTVLEKKGTWYKIDLGNGKAGYIWEGYVKQGIDTAAVPLETTVTTAKVTKTVNVGAVNVRSGAGRYTVLGVLKKGEAVSVTGNVNGWDKIDYEGGIGYVDARYLTR